MTGSAFARAAAPDHKAVARMVGFSLHLSRGHDLEPFRGLATVLRARLTPAERQGLAWAALLACEPDEAQGIAESLFDVSELKGAGAPLPPFLDVVDDAAWWASIALPEERRAYAVAAFLALSPADQADFLSTVTRRIAA